jgi:thiamine-phosphate pyrophosphorylase
MQGDLQGFVHKLEAVASAGVDWIQIREKDLSARDLTWLTSQILSPARGGHDLAGTRNHGARIIVNDRLDVALAERAGGVHLGESSLPVIDAKRLAIMRGVSDDFLVGVSCHSLEAAKFAEREGADYLFFGPIFATPSKVRFGAPQGLERLAVVCDSVSIPVIAIGAITLENASTCLAAGAAGIAAIRLFQQASDPKLVVDGLRKALSRPSE